MGRQGVERQRVKELKSEMLRSAAAGRKGEILTKTRRIGNVAGTGSGPREYE
jgi:hypothetical protein